MDVKRYCVSLLEKFGSFDYTRQTLIQLDLDARREIEKLGGNPILEKVLDELKNWWDNCRANSSSRKRNNGWNATYIALLAFQRSHNSFYIFISVRVKNTFVVEKKKSLCCPFGLDDASSHTSSSSLFPLFKTISWIISWHFLVVYFHNRVYLSFIHLQRWFPPHRISFRDDRSTRNYPFCL